MLYAPVTTATSICNAEVGMQVNVPITVTGFSNISAVSLTMIYDASKLRYVNFTKNPLLVGTCNVGDKDLLNGFHRLTLSWFKAFAPGVTLDNGTPIANYVFEFISGPATLEWVDMGPSCEFVDPNGIILTDTPTSNFYINGTISSSCQSLPIIAASGPTSFCEGGSVELTASTGSAWKWSPGGATTQKITVTTSGNYTVEVTDAGGAKATSAATLVTVNPLPAAPSVNVVNNCDGTSTLTASGYTGTLSWSTTETTAAITVSSSGTYTVTQTVDGCTSLAGSGMAAPKTAPATPSVNVVNNCNGTSTLTASGYTGTLLWSTTETTESIIVSTAAIYTVTQTLAGCTSAPGSGTAAPKTAPSAFAVTGGGSFCYNSEGYPVGLAGSQIGVSYTLFMNGDAMIPAITREGTGAAIDFGNHAPGTYTVKGTKADCTTDMTGSALITEKPAPTLNGLMVTSITCEEEEVEFDVWGLLASVTNTIHYDLTLDGVTTAGYKEVTTIEDGTAKFYLSDCHPGSYTFKITSIVFEECRTEITSQTVFFAVSPKVPAIVSLAASSNPVCAGTPVTFTATPVGGGSTPVYKWYKGATVVGDDQATYTYIPSDGDVISVKMWSSEICATGSPATSDEITMSVNSLPLAPTVDLTQPTCTSATGTISVNSEITGLSFSIDGSDFSNITGIFTEVSSGIHSLKAKSLAGCISPETNVTINAPLDAPAAPIVNVVNNCNGTSTLTASGYTGTLLWSNGETTESITVSAAGSYTVTQTVEGCQSEAGSGTAVVTTCTNALNLSVFLEGPFSGSSMATTLNTNSWIQLTQPYGGTPWNYTGTEQVSEIPTGVVDWVLVELRQAASPDLATSETILNKRAAFVKSNGSVVDLDGSSPVSFDNLSVTAGNNLYVVIRHRNHLAIMSANAAVLTGGVYNYDFTTGINQTYGGENGFKQVGSAFVMVAGDIYQDGGIWVDDYNDWASEFGATDGYFKSDLDMDGQSYTPDFNNWAINFASEVDDILKSAKLKTKYISGVPK